MSIVSFTPIADGTTADGADVNTPLTTLYNDYNGNIDNSNIAAAAAISATKLAANSITNSQLATSVSPVTRGSETIFDHIASGCVWTADAAGSTRLASMTSGVVYIAGVRLTVAAVTSRTFTASKDVYVDFSDNGDGTALLTYTDNTNNAASPALAANSIRNAIVVVGATSIAAAASINQGQEDRVLPIASSVPYAVTDSLGNLICPRDPQRRTLGYRQILSTFTLSSSQTTPTQITGLSCPVKVPTGRKIKIEVFNRDTFNATASNSTQITIWDGTVNSGTQIASGFVAPVNTSAAAAGICSAQTTPASSSKTYNAGLQSGGATNVTFEAAATAPAYIKVSLA